MRKGVTLRAGSETPMGAAKVVQNLVEAFAKKEVAGWQLPPN